MRLIGKDASPKNSEAVIENEINSSESSIEPAASPNKNNYQGWPPPLPTHPPNHTPATHPPHIAGDSAPGKPGTTTKKPPQTTWPTRPIYGETTRPPQQWPPALPTHPSFTTMRPSYLTTTETSNEISNQGCGQKNGNLVRNQFL